MQTSFYQVGVLSSNPNVPVYYYNPDNYEPVIVFNTYNNTAPPSSVFDLPAGCMQRDHAHISWETLNYIVNYNSVHEMGKKMLADINFYR